jgi:hypothetical protein
VPGKALFPYRKSAKSGVYFCTLEAQDCGALPGGCIIEAE